jgi:hypothetical protein
MYLKPTTVNYYTGGPFELVLNAVQHTVIESYIAKRTPDIRTFKGPAIVMDDISIGDKEDGLEDFIYQEMINASPDSKLKDLLVGDGAKFSLPKYFSELKVYLDNERKNNSSDLLTLYYPFWIDAIDKGLKDWPSVSHALARAAIIPDRIDREAVDAISYWYIYNHLLTMSGVPDFMVDEIVNFQEIASLLQTLMPGPIAESLEEL